MRLENYLNEKYHTRIGETEVFVNPSWKELMEATDRGVDELRFSAYHDTKKVYVWNANSLLHDDFEKKVFGHTTWETNEYLLQGVLEKKGNMFATFSSDQLEMLPPSFRRKILSLDWSWLTKYKIDISTILKFYKH